eukprot:PhF_6_TR44203/c1_g1_i7/m.67851
MRKQIRPNPTSSDDDRYLRKEEELRCCKVENNQLKEEIKALKVKFFKLLEDMKHGNTIGGIHTGDQPIPAQPPLIQQQHNVIRSEEVQHLHQYRHERAQLIQKIETLEHQLRNAHRDIQALQQHNQQQTHHPPNHVSTQQHKMKHTQEVGIHANIATSAATSNTTSN